MIKILTTLTSNSTVLRQQNKIKLTDTDIKINIDINSILIFYKCFNEYQTPFMMNYSNYARLICYFLTVLSILVIYTWL